MLFILLDGICDDFLGLFVVFLDDVDWDFGWKNCNF